ncbi:uncharacterized protein [Watersipora subatra]|uniref:uncharacterized protein n=1 Tax=Watersipora subatra TaxID=2589382 RepID=UPI00355BE6C7
MPETERVSFRPANEMSSKVRLPSSYSRCSCKQRPMNCILPHLMNRQLTGKPMSQSKQFLRATIKCLRTAVKPRRLQDLVQSIRQLHKRVFLGFLKGSHWLVSYQYIRQDENSITPFELDQLPNQAPSDYLLEFWLYHPNKPLELKYVRNLFPDLDSGCISYLDESMFSVYQWIDDPRYLLVFGERVFYHDEQCVDKGSLLSITYLPVPAITPQPCSMCLKSESTSTFSCVKHDSLLNFFGHLATRHQLDAEKHLKRPNTLYLNLSDQTLYCVSISHSALSGPAVVHNCYGNLVSNIRTTVYSGYTTSNASEVNGVSEACDDFSIKCTTNKGLHYLPLEADRLTPNTANSVDLYLVVRRSWIDLELFIIDQVFPIMREQTSWYNSDCVLKDWTAEYIEICAETGKAVCEVTFKIGEDPRYFDHLARHICSVTFIWDVQSGKVEINQFDEGILIMDDKVELGERLLTKRARNPGWVAKLAQKHRQPKAEKAVIELNNVPYMRGESLSRLVSLDRTAVITL